MYNVFIIYDGENMVKKLVVITVMLMHVMISTALADVCYPSVTTGGEIITIEYKIQTTEIGIGEEIVCDMTITNLSNKSLEIYDISFSGLNFCVDGVFAGMFPYKGLCLQINAYETVYLEIKGIVGDDLRQVKKVGDSFYVDVLPVVRYAEEQDLRDVSFKEFFLYLEYGETVPIEITNLNDGSEYIEFEWMDDRDIFCLYKELDFSLDNITENVVCKYGEGKGEFRYTNIGDVELLGLQPGENYSYMIEFIETIYMKIWKMVFHILFVEHSRLMGDIIVFQSQEIMM